MEAGGGRVVATGLPKYVTLEPSKVEKKLPPRA
jgi:hypothetical protein